MNIGERLALILEENDLTQKEFAEAVGISTSSVNRIIYGTQGMNKATKLLVCEKFGINMAWLETGEGNRHKTLSCDECVDRFRNVLACNPEIQRMFVSVVEKMTPEQWKKVEAFFASIQQEKPAM